MNPKVLLVDDDVELTSMLSEYLVADGFDVSVAHNGEAGVRAALSGDNAIVVLDVMMPGMSGIEALGRIRASSGATSAIPVLMLTARGDDTDRVVGLELGADDYVPKPCTPRELAARIRAILRRSPSANRAPTESNPVSVISVGELNVWPEQRRAEWGGKALELTSTEFSLLETLARNAGQAVSKAHLSEEAMGRPLTRFDRSIDVHMSSIRHKLGVLPDGRSCIQTVYRKGYQLIRS
ncbi:response regulator transcription factor [Uliginosibacterium sp. H3]|uniref:Response regulator transcription factor n=1 Tax=Uliginosibacterium silvisoli TaxID=3114758 RepID=A0ABU6K2Q0_9RHOO|nr:response regulator transcription factor [Uliginosibacterium sp. H3]